MTGEEALNRLLHKLMPLLRQDKVINRLVGAFILSPEC
jgi:hypothetical protein